VLVLFFGDRDNGGFVGIDGTRCMTALRALRALAPVRHLGSEPFRISISLGQVRQGTRSLESIDATICPRDPIGPMAYARKSIEVLSLVGPVLTMSIYGESQNGGAPSTWERWRTIDVRTGRPMRLEDVVLVDDAPFLAAVRTLASSNPNEFGDLRPALEAPTTYDEARRILHAAEAAAEEDAFTIDDWDAASRTVGLKMAFRRGDSWNSGTELVAVRARPRAWFERHVRAAAGRGGPLWRRPK
jgi:hypothetical protein